MKEEQNPKVLHPTDRLYLTFLSLTWSSLRCCANRWNSSRWSFPCSKSSQPTKTSPFPAERPCCMCCVRRAVRCVLRVALAHKKCSKIPIVPDQEIEFILFSREPRGGRDGGKKSSGEVPPRDAPHSDFVIPLLLRPKGQHTSFGRRYSNRITFKQGFVCKFASISIFIFCRVNPLRPKCR